MTVDSVDPVIIDAENTLMLYARYLREIPSPTVPRQWVATLVETLEAVLNAHAELEVSFEPPPGGADETDMGSDWPPDELEPDDYETRH